MSKFKTGDKVVCTDNKEVEDHLSVGTEYTVLSVHHNCGQHIAIISDKGSTYYFMVERFELKPQDSYILEYKGESATQAVKWPNIGKLIPQVIQNERIVPTDIDETLVMHENPEQYALTIEVEDPHHKGAMILLGVNEPMVKILKDEKARGAYIIAWSRSGYAWANTIIKALNLENYVDTVMTKPLVYLDDSDVSTWLKDRVWLKPTTTYKKHITK